MHQIVFGVGKFVSSYFSVPFSFIGHEFLTKAFTLPRHDKEDFAITKMIERLNPSLAKIPYISGNINATKEKEISFKHK